MEPGDIVIRPFTPAEAQQAAHWAYEAPFDRYDSEPANELLFLDVKDDGAGFYAVVDQGSHPELVGFCCFGEEARVLGQGAEEGTVDLGGGVRPDRLSQGLATSLMPLVCSFAIDRWHPKRLRVAIAAFNQRSIRLCRSAQFEAVRAFRRPDGDEFVELVRPVTSTSSSTS